MLCKREAYGRDAETEYQVVLWWELMGMVCLSGTVITE